MNAHGPYTSLAETCGMWDVGRVPRSWPPMQDERILQAGPTAGHKYRARISLAGRGREK